MAQYLVLPIAHSARVYHRVPSPTVNGNQQNPLASAQQVSPRSKREKQVNFVFVCVVQCLEVSMFTLFLVS